VIADTETLSTLSDDEFRSGLGEVVKTALIAGEDALLLLERNSERIVKRDPETMAEIVATCVNVKAEIVKLDPFEKSERKRLNLGHTFAHGIEHAAGYGKIPHGVAVGVGILLSLWVSRETGLLRDEALPQRVRDLFLRFGMSTSIDALRRASRTQLTAADILAGTRHDKKGAAGKPRLVLLRAPGSLEIDVESNPEVLGRCLAEG
jgi:3-dehydroquinate synthetase